jgi:hypothetical protein
MRDKRSDGTTIAMIVAVRCLYELRAPTGKGHVYVPRTIGILGVRAWVREKSNGLASGTA